VLLHLVAVVPDVIDRAALSVQQALPGLNPVAVDKYHCISIQVLSSCRSITSTRREYS
jgi:hypothetical protein